MTTVIMGKFARILIALSLLAAIVFAAKSWYDGVVQDTYTRGEQAERATWQAKEDRRKEGEKQAILDRDAENRRKQAENDLKTLKVAQDHEKIQSQLKAKIAQLSSANAAAGGLRVPREICDGIAPGTQASGDGEHDAYLAATIQLPASTERFLYQEADRADEIVEVARECQNWVRTHGFYLIMKDAPPQDFAR